MRNTEANGPFYDYKKYINRLVKAIQSVFEQPFKLDCLKVRTDNDGRVMGWEIEETKFVFKNRGDYVKVIERSEYFPTRNCFYLNSFSYHFQPSEVDHLIQFRVDLDHFSLHGNPDKRFTDKEHLLYPEDLRLKLSEFNALAAFYVAQRYIYSRHYPFDNNYADTYNQIVCNVLGGERVG